MRTRIPAIARKETLHVLRDWRTLGMAFGMPVIMITLFSYAITFDIKNLRLAVADLDRSKESRALLERFTSGGYFKMVQVADHPEELPRLLDAGQAQIAMAIPEGFGSAIARNETKSIQVLLDGSDSNTATISAGYVDNIIMTYDFELIRDALSRFGLAVEGVPPIDARIRVWFNPELDSTNTIVPGLIAVIMMTVTALLTSITVVRERENGSLEGLIATPVRKHEILIGKMLPYLAIALADCLLVTGVGYFVFGVPFAGDLVYFSVAALIYSVAGLSIGLMASVVASNQLLANQIVVLSTMLPSLLLSGFMFPIKSMPEWVRIITYAFPARYFVSICRGTLLKGQTAEFLLKPTLFLVIFSAVMMSLSVARFRKKLF